MHPCKKKKKHHQKKPQTKTRNPISDADILNYRQEMNIISSPDIITLGHITPQQVFWLII